MSVFAVTNRRGRTPALPAAQPQEGIGRRVRRALVLSGWLALILGQALGLLMANPALLTSRLSFTLDPMVIALGGFGLTGLLTGVVAGLALRGASPLLRWSVAVFGVLVGLIVFEIAYGLLRGMTLESALLADDGLKVAQMGLGVLCASVGVLAGRTSRPRITSGASPAPSARRQPSARSSARSTRTPSRGETRGSARGRGQQPSSSRTPQRQSRGRASGRPAAAGSVSAASAGVGSTSTPSSRPAKRRKHLGFSRRQVQLGREQTAVCPYCLEEVKHNDPRGKVVCRICGTPHHADCWAITGKCEVPHLQT